MMRITSWPLAIVLLSLAATRSATAAGIAEVRLLSVGKAEANNHDVNVCSPLRFAHPLEGAMSEMNFDLPTLKQFAP